MLSPVLLERLTGTPARAWNGWRYVYLVYSDDSARDNKWQVISAVIIKDKAYDTIELALAGTIEAYVPQEMWPNFEFHAVDLWNRTGPFSKLD